MRLLKDKVKTYVNRFFTWMDANEGRPDQVFGSILVLIGMAQSLLHSEDDILLILLGFAVWLHGVNRERIIDIRRDIRVLQQNKGDTDN